MRSANYLLLCSSLLLSCLCHKPEAFSLFSIRVNRMAGRLEEIVWSFDGRRNKRDVVERYEFYPRDFHGFSVV